MWHVANVNSREDIQKQLNKYLNEVAIRKISKENPLTYENTVGFFKRLIEDYFTISKKN